MAAAAADSSWHRKRCKSGEAPPRPRRSAGPAPGEAVADLLLLRTGRYADQVTPDDLQALFHLVSGWGAVPGRPAPARRSQDLEPCT